MTDAEYRTRLKSEVGQARWWFRGYIRAARRRYWPSWADPIEAEDQWRRDHATFRAEMHVSFGVGSIATGPLIVSRVS